MKTEYIKPVMRARILKYQLHLLSISGKISGYSQSSNGFSQEEENEVKSQGDHVLWEDEFEMTKE